MEGNVERDQKGQGILRTRSKRRTLVVYILIGVIVLIALGMSVLSAWLAQDIKLLSLYWGIVLMLTCLVMILALYDMTRVVKEEKAAHNKEMAKCLRELAEEIKEHQEKNENKEN